MRFIVLDTTDARGSVALFSEGLALGREVHSEEEDYSVWLLPAVQRVLQTHGVSLAQLDGYAVCAGPGSFTGVRVGLTTVKAWAEIYGKPIIPVSRLEALAVQGPVDPKIPETYVATYFDARRGQCFACLYRQDPHRQDDETFAQVWEESVIGPAEFLAKVSAETVGQAVRWRTPDPELVQNLPEWSAAAKSGQILEVIKPPFADRLGWLAWKKFQHNQTSDGLSLDANYVRRTDAELFWKGSGSPLTR